jgi:hypothetical protein
MGAWLFVQGLESEVAPREGATSIGSILLRIDLALNDHVFLTIPEARSKRATVEPEVDHEQSAARWRFVCCVGSQFAPLADATAGCSCEIDQW